MSTYPTIIVDSDVTRGVMAKPIFYILSSVHTTITTTTTYSLYNLQVSIITSTMSTYVVNHPSMYRVHVVLWPYSDPQ